MASMHKGAWCTTLRPAGFGGARANRWSPRGGLLEQLLVHSPQQIADRFGGEFHFRRFGQAFELYFPLSRA